MIKSLSACFCMLLCFTLFSQQPAPVDTANAEHYTWGAACDGWHLVKSDDLSVIRESMPSGTSEQLHYHERAQQFFYILSGNATFFVEGDTIRVSPVKGLSIKPMVQHQISNGGNESLEFLVVSSPRSHGDRVNITD